MAQNIWLFLAKKPICFREQNCWYTLCRRSNNIPLTCWKHWPTGSILAARAKNVWFVRQIFVNWASPGFGPNLKKVRFLSNGTFSGAQAQFWTEENTFSLGTQFLCKGRLLPYAWQAFYHHNIFFRCRVRAILGQESFFSENPSSVPLHCRILSTGDSPCMLSKRAW